MVNILITGILLFIVLFSVMLVGLELLIRFRILNVFPVIDTLVISFGAGFGVIALLVFLLGICHLLYLSAIFIVVTTLLLLNIRLKIRFIRSLDLKQHIKRFSGLNLIYKGLLLFLLLFAMLNFFRALVPVTDHDSIEAYLFIPKLFAESHSINRLSFTMWDDLPLNVQMISVLALLIKDGAFAQMLSGYIFGILSTIVIYLTGKQIVNSNAGIIAAVLFYSIPEVVWLTCSAKVDLGWAFWEFSAFYLFVAWIKSSEKTSDREILWLSFVFLGFSLGAKYLTLLSIIFYDLALVFILYKVQSYNIKKAIVTIFIANTIAFVIASPYLIKNAIFTLNPLFPYIFSNVNSYMFSGPEYTGLTGIINYYWNLFFRFDFLVKPMYYLGASSFGPLIIGFLPAFVLDKGNRRIFILFVLLWFCITLIMMQIYLPQPRHLLNTVPLILIPVSAGISILFTQNKIWRITFLFIILSFLFISLARKANYFLRNEAGVVFGNETEASFLERELFSKSKHFNTGMMSFIKDNLDKDSRIMTLYYCQAYYVDRVITTDYNLENKFIYQESNIDSLIYRLHDLNITHIYLSDTDYNTREDLWKKNFAKTIVLSDEFKNKYLLPVFSSADQHLYSIKYTIKP